MHTDRAEDGVERGAAAKRRRNAARVSVRCCRLFRTVSRGRAPLATAPLTAAVADEQQPRASCALKAAACSARPSPP